jgi:hypothetical protein
MTTPIVGYRELSEGDIALINEIKEQGNALGHAIDMMELGGETFDQRWVAIGKTHMQQGLMALVRAVAQPTNF